jgi:hypothetical protein
LSNEEKTNDYENFEKGMIYRKKGGSREKGGGGNEIHAPCACGSNARFWVPGVFPAFTKTGSDVIM